MAILAAGRKIAPAAILGNLVALGAGLLVMLVLGEVALRVVDLGHPYYSAPELYQPSDDPRVLFEPRPSFDGFSEGVWLTTNSRGLRERELPLAEARRHPARRLPRRLGHVRGRRQGRRAVPAPAGDRRQRRRRRLDPERQHRRRRLQHHPGAGPTGAGRPAVPAGRGRADVRRQRPAGDVLDLRPPVRADRPPGRPEGLAPPQQPPLPLRPADVLAGRPGAAPGPRGPHRAAPQARARRRAAGDPLRDDPHDPRAAAPRFLLVLYPDNLGDPVSPGPPASA